MLDAVEKTAVRAAEAFGLGGVRASTEVAGGLSNDLWKVTTSHGVVAVKVMRAHADAPGFRDAIEAAFAIEERNWRAGIPCPEPLPTVDGHALVRVDGSWARAHRWCPGTPPTAREHLADAGRLLSDIHRVGALGPRRLTDRPRGLAAWSALAARPGLPLSFTDQLRDAAPELAHLEAATAAPSGLLTPHADSHGDLDPKNTLVWSGRLAAVDWDAAGPRSVVREAVTLALDWSETPDEFREVLAAYTARSGMALPKAPWVLGGWVAGLSDWLAFSIDQSSGSELGRREAASTCARLLSLHRSMDEYLAVLADV